ncbi:exodeoxyribonuclease VII small subunit [Clostridiaceae bacterium]|jgi:exodeoxyribonuclease VII small subunit|nr:exodeoxyribonuclease VII small subunit [Clostridium sp.]NBI69528.1 exodeoxyribonuclease VII small subunit [Clostridiaceae bacterium]
MAEKESAGQELSVEEAFEKLEGIIEALEDGDISLEDSFSYYEAGMRLVKQCGEKIDRVEKKILVLEDPESEG